MFASLQLPFTPLPVVLHLFPLPTLEVALGYATIDGCYVSQEEGEAALRTGMALLVGGLLVGLGNCG